jgi:CRP-like cAMP-binding protein
MRQHSVQIRCLKANSHETMVEDSIANITDKVAKSVLVVTCRNKQRLLQQAWGIWTRNTNVIHDYVVDLLTIMSRILRDDEYRTELEIEVVCKWVLQNQAIDPTGLAYSLHRCSSRVAVINAIQSARLERYDPGAAVLIQNEMPKPEDGHFTIITGSCEIIAFKSDSGHLLDIHTARKNKQYDIVESLLEQGKVLNKLVYPSGFGELSALTKVNRNACVRAGNDGYLQLLVIPRDELLVCLQHRKIMSSNHNSVPAEVMDFIRQSGLVRQASMTDFMNIASSMTKKVYKRGSILFRKGEPARVLYLIVQGEVFLDTSELQSPSPANPMSGEEELPFQHLDPEKCYFLGAGAMLGDEGICGANHNFESSAVVISELAVFFEVKGIGFDFLSTRVGYEKYTALGYMREKVDDPPLVSYASELVLHGNFTSLRNAIAANNPYRGQVLTDFPASNSTPVKHRSSHKKHQHDTSGALYMSKKIKFTAATVRDAAVAALRTDVVSTVEKNQAVLDRDDNNGVYVLPAAAMYHMHSITKILKKRATQALRASAQVF